MPLTIDQVRAAEIIASGQKYQVAADEVGVHIATVKRWTKNSEEFQQAVERARRRGDSSDPVEVLRGALAARDPRGHPDWRVRVQAACKLLDREPPKATPKPENDYGLVWTNPEQS